MLRGIDHDSIHLQQFHATRNAQLFQYTRCNSKNQVASCMGAFSLSGGDMGVAVRLHVNI